MISSDNYPAQYESRLTLRDGREVFIRPIMQSDDQLVIDLFNKLSRHSIYLRFLRHLNALPVDMLHRFTHIDYKSDFALVGIVKEDDNDVIIAVARYLGAAEDNFTELAIVVRDDWQHLGLGKALLKKVVEIGREHGIYRFVGILDPENNLIRQILTELGFKVSYTLKSGIYQVEISV
jgi:acetyltransferase